MAAKPMIHTATLDAKQYELERACPNCDDHEVTLIHFEISGSDGHNSEFILCAECVVEMIENVSSNKPDSANVNTPS